jgi:hypothetical protein
MVNLKVFKFLPKYKISYLYLYTIYVSKKREVVIIMNVYIGGITMIAYMVPFYK